MMQFASDGQWGRGLYFAEDAGYSHFYATAGSGFNKPPPGSHDAQLGELRADELELLCCDLLLGSVAEMDRDYGQDKTACPGVETEMRVVCGGKGGKGGLKTPPFVNAKPPVRWQPVAVFIPLAQELSESCFVSLTAGCVQQLRQGGDRSEGKFDTVMGWTQTDKKLPDGRWIKNPDCPRSKAWIVYENGRACTCLVHSLRSVSGC